MMDKKKGSDTVPADPLVRYFEEKDVKQREFADRVDASEQMITNWKKRGIPAGKVGVVAHAMGLSYEQYVEAAKWKPPKKAAQRRAAAKGGNAIAVPVFGIEGSMGTKGSVVQSVEPIIGGMSLSRDWVRGRLPALTSVDSLAVITASGDSMAPTFVDGDILLVDRGVNDVRSDAVYVIGRGDQLFVKRVQRKLAGELVIRSDNPLFESEVVRGAEIDNVRIHGRVVWAWNGKRL